MGLLVTLAGLIILAYTVSSALALWLAGKASAARAQGVAVEPPLSEAPSHHIALLSDYTSGRRGAMWTVSVACLLATLAGMAFSSPVTPYVLGVALIIDSALFLTYENRAVYVAATSAQERLIDALQCCALLGAFAILFWTRTIVA